MFLFFIINITCLAILTVRRQINGADHQNSVQYKYNTQYKTIRVTKTMNFILQERC